MADPCLSVLTYRVLLCPHCQIVKNTCVELDLGDTDAIPVALRKMKRVIAMVPT